MKKFYTKNNVYMIQCGDYNWEIIYENKNKYTYEMVLLSRKYENDHIRILYNNGIMILGKFKSNFSHESSADIFRFKIPFEETPKFIEYIIETGDYDVEGIFNNYKEKNN